MEAPRRRAQRRAAAHGMQCLWSLTQRCEESGTHGGRPSDVPGGTEQRQRSFNQTASPRQSARITRYRVWSTVTRRVWQYRSWRRRSALGLSGEDHAPRLAHAPPNAHARGCERIGKWRYAGMAMRKRNSRRALRRIRTPRALPPADGRASGARPAWAHAPLLLEVWVTTNLRTKR